MEKDGHIQQKKHITLSGWEKLVLKDDCLCLDN